MKQNKNNRFAALLLALCMAVCCALPALAAPAASANIDLSRTAFKKIGAEVDGIIPITYRTVTAAAPSRQPRTRVVGVGSSGSRACLGSSARRARCRRRWPSRS